MMMHPEMDGQQVGILIWGKINLFKIDDLMQLH
jgi:hypothetical protein